MGFLALDFSFCLRVYSAKFITLCLGFVPSCVDAASSSVTLPGFMFGGFACLVITPCDLLSFTFDILSPISISTSFMFA